MSDLVERLRSSAPLPLCPFEKRSPEYWTTPNDKPCKFCGGLPEGPDKCTGADMRIMLEAADEIERLRALSATQEQVPVEVAIKRAIMAERHRCKKIADIYARNNKGGGHQAYAAFVVSTEIGNDIDRGI